MAMRVKNKNDRIKYIKTQNLDPNTMTDLIRNHNSLRGLWKTRKIICMDVIDMITESSNKKMKDFLVS